MKNSNIMIKLHRGNLRLLLIIFGILLIRYGINSFGAGIGVFFSGLALHFISKGFLHRNVELAIRGPYSFTRHPFYIANLLLDMGIILMCGYPLFIPVYLFLYYKSYHRVILDEESELINIYGDLYKNYAEKVPRYFLKITPYVKDWYRGFKWENILREREISRVLRLCSYPISFFIIREIVKNKWHELILSKIILWVGISLFLLLTSYLFHNIVERDRIYLVKNKLFLWFWLVMALVLRLYKITLIKCIAVDGVAYVGIAKDWITGCGFNPNWPPLYPWFISLLIRLGFNPELGGQLVSVVFGVAVVAMVYIMTRSIFSPAIANISTIFSVFHPYLVRYSAEVLSDSLFIFLVTSCVFCGWLMLKNNKLLLAVLTGFLTGMAYLTKPEGMFLLLIISFWWLVAIKSIWYKRLGLILCAWVVFFVISFPYIHAVREKTGRWMISQKETIVFSVALQEEGYASEFLNISPLQYARENPKNFLLKTGSGLLSLLGRIPDAYHPVLFLFLIIGIASGIKEKKFLLYIITFLIPFFIGYAVFNPGRRYLIGWVPLTLFLSAYGMERIIKLMKNSWLPILAAVLIMMPKTMESVRDSAVKWKEAGLWIKNNSKTEVSVMSRDIRTAFYAGREYLPWTKDDFSKAGFIGFIVTDKDLILLKKTYRTSRGLNIYYEKM